MRTTDPSLIDMLKGIATALMAAGLMLAALFVPILLVMGLSREGAAWTYASVILAAGLALLVYWWTRSDRRFAGRRH